MEYNYIPYMRDIIDNFDTSENKEIIIYKSSDCGPTKVNNDITDLWKALYFDLAIRKIKRLIAHKCMVTTAELLQEYNGFLTEV